jgi:MerR family transcriptional regulator/heat shock protein HspR
MISAVAEMFNIHPQTLRLYEREGLLVPSRTDGNTRYYTQRDLDRLELILKMSRDLGVNLAGIEIILNMRERMEEMQREMRAFVEFVRTELLPHAGEAESRLQTALVRVTPPHLSRLRVRRSDTAGKPAEK